jgi:hypothetical protein
MLKSVTYENTTLRKLLGHKDSVINYLTNLPAGSQPSRSTSAGAARSSSGGVVVGDVLGASSVENALARHQLVDLTSQKQMLFDALTRLHTIINSAEQVRRHDGVLGAEFRRACEAVYADLGLSLEVAMPLECSLLTILPSCGSRSNSRDSNARKVSVRSVAVPPPAAAEESGVPVRHLRDPQRDALSAAAGGFAPQRQLKSAAAPSSSCGQRCRGAVSKKARVGASGGSSSMSVFEKEIARLREERMQLEKESDDLTLQLYAGGIVPKGSGSRSRSAEPDKGAK